MDSNKSIDSQEDNAPPAAFIQIKDIFDKNNKPKQKNNNDSFFSLNKNSYKGITLLYFSQMKIKFKEI